MGWSYGWKSKSDLVHMLKTDFIGLKTSCVRGNMFWGVADYKGENVIVCAIIGSSDGEWGYKGMDESMGPYYYNCPLSYLDMAPVQNAEWREKVREYFSRPAIKAGSKLIAKPDSPWNIKGGEHIETLEIASLRPLFGYANGYYRLKLNRRCLKSFTVAEAA